MVELAVVSPVTVLLLLGTIETGRMFWINHTLQYAVDDTGRYAMVNRTGDTGALTTYLTGKLGGMADAALTVEVSQSTAAGVTYVTITARKPFVFAGGLVSGLDATLAGSTSVPLLPAS